MLLIKKVKGFRIQKRGSGAQEQRCWREGGGEVGLAAVKELRTHSYCTQGKWVLSYTSAAPTQRSSVIQLGSNPAGPDRPLHIAGTILIHDR